MAEPQPATKAQEGVTKTKEPIDYAKKYWWVAVIMPLVIFLLARLWPEPRTAPPPVSSVTNLVTIQNEFLSVTGNSLDDSDLKRLIQQALDLTAKGDYRGSIALYQEALKQAPVPALYNNLGAAYAEINDIHHAREALQQALVKNPNYEIARRNLEAMNGADAYFHDQFSESQLTRDWTMMNPDPGKWSMQPNQKSVLIVTQKGVLSDSKSLKNWLVLNKELPTGDFEIIVEASLQIQGVGNDIAMALFADDQNYLFFGFNGDPWGQNIARTPHFSQILRGANTADLTGERRYGAAAEPEHIFFRIDRSGNQYSALYAYVKNGTDSNQIQWTKIGTLPWLNFNGKLVLFASNFADNAPEVAGEFHSVLIRRE